MDQHRVAVTPTAASTLQRRSNASDGYEREAMKTIHELLTVDAEAGVAGEINF